MSFVLRLARNLLLFVVWPLRITVHLLRRPRARWIALTIRPRVVEIEARRPFWQRFMPGMDDPPTELHRLRCFVDEVSRDSHVEGVLVTLTHLHAGWSECEGLREALLRLREAGKKTYVHLGRGGGQKELFVASAADRVLMAPRASLSLPGVGTESFYWAAALERVGVRVERFARAEYKTAYETFERDAMSEGQREQITALLTDVQSALESALERRLGSSERVKQIFAEAFLPAARAKELGIVDELVYEDELPTALGLGEKQRPLPAGAYDAWHRFRSFVPMRRRPYVAIVPIRGVIVERGTPGHDLPAVQGALRHAARDRKAVAVVLYVDSPGGSALASDLIHRDVEALAEKKPVIAFFGAVAASGGYYVAAPAHTIVARPLTITGSIGVLAARLSIAALLERLGVRREVVRMTEHADVWSAGRSLTDAERVLFDREIESVYRGFVEVVATGRKRPPEEVEPLARGRVWSGGAAMTRGLVDRLGGLDVAVTLATDAARARGVRARLEPEVIRLRAGLVPPPLYRRPVPASRSWLSALGEAWPLLSSGERAFLYDPWLHGGFF